jgi:large subunit ribosomal protein L24
LKKEGTTKPRTTRKAQRNSPLHIRRKFLSAPLSPSLKTQHGAKTMPIIEDDTVQIIKGDRKMTEGKVLRVDTQEGKLFVEGVSRTRLDGTTVQIPIRSANVMITKLDLKDDWRKKILDRKGFKKEE